MRNLYSEQVVIEISANIFLDWIELDMQIVNNAKGKKVFIFGHSITDL